MEKSLIVIIKSLIIGITISGLTYYVDLELYHQIIAEDGIVENITAFTLLTISIMFLIRLIKVRKNKLWISFGLLMVVLGFFGFGEEISWGQRIFEVESGEFFNEFNSQGETNLHNLQVNGVKMNKLIFSIGLTIVSSIYFLFFLLLYKKNNLFKNLIDKFGLQIPKLKHTLILVATTAIILIIPDNKKWELWETVYVLILLLVFLEPYNKDAKLIYKDKLRF